MIRSIGAIMSCDEPDRPEVVPGVVDGHVWSSLAVLQVGTLEQQQQQLLDTC